jgi:hypothetical protein
MLARRLSLALAVALIPWPGLAQEAPKSVKGPTANSATKPAAIVVPPPALPSKDSPSDTAIKPIAESTQPKDAASAGPATNPADLPQQEALHPVWSSVAPLSAIGEPNNTALSFGWWSVQNNGSPVKTGEYQGLSSSPFWEINGLYSNGHRTLGIYGNQTDNESNQASLHYFGPKWFTNIDYQRFIHRLDHIPLDNFLPDNAATAKLPNNTYVAGQDLNVGEDYAIRVEEFRADMGSRINENLRFRVDVWQMRKFGERQGNAAAHCFALQANPNSRGCHVLSQSQHIDWLTTEVTPRLEGKVGPVTIEYSRPMRQFTQNDQLIFRDYQGRGGMIKGTYPYAIVPESTTQIDQLKGVIDLGPMRQFYVFGYIGNTNQHDRDVDRSFNGYDVRLTDWSLPRTSVTLYARGFNQTGNLPTSLLTSETATGPKGESQPLPATTPATPPADYIAFPLEFHRNTGGIKSSWRPDLKVGLFTDLAFTSGYEYDFMDRVNAIWQTPPRGPQAGLLENRGATVFRQGDTTTQTLFAGLAKPWRYGDDKYVDTYARYKVLFVQNPLLGIRQLNEVVNTNQPQQKHIVEFGGGWYPLSNFAVTLQQNIEVGQTNYDNNAEATGNIVDFREQNYNTTVTMWYAPTSKLSLLASVSIFSNWINQSMFLGDNYFDSEAPPSPPSANLPLAIQPTFYTGTANMLNLYLNYKVTENVRLTCGYQFVRGNNEFQMNATPSFAFPPSLSTNEPKGSIVFTDLPRYSAVLVETQKITAGITWRARPSVTVYCLYNFFDYNDKTTNYNSGTAHMVMAGMSSIW